MGWRERNRDMKKGSQSRAEALPQLKEWTSKELDHPAREVARTRKVQCIAYSEAICYVGKPAGF